MCNFLVFADNADPNKKGTHGGRIYCSSDANGEITSGFFIGNRRKLVA